MHKPNHEPPHRGRSIEESLYRLFGQDSRQARIEEIEGLIVVEVLVWYSTSGGFSEVTDRHPAVARLRELIEERRALLSR